MLRGASRLDLAVSVPTFAAAGMPSPLRTSSQFESSFLASGRFRLDLPALLLDAAHLGTTLLLRSLTRLGLAVLVSDLSNVGLSLSLRSFSKLGLVLVALDFGHSGSSSFPHSHTRSGSLAFVSGLGRPGSVSILLVIEGSRPGSLPFLRSFSRPGAAASILDSGQADPFLLTQSHAWLGTAAASPGLTRAGFVFPLSVSEASRLGFATLLQSHLRLGSLLAVSDFAKPDVFLSAHSRSCAGVTLLPFGAACSGSLSTALDSAGFEFASFARSFLHMDVGIPMFGCCRLGPPLPTLNPLGVDASLPLRSRG